MNSLTVLQELIHEKYGIADADPQASLKEKGFDSLAIVEFIFAIEDKFGIAMPDEDAKIDTLAELAAVVDRLVAEKAAAAEAKAA